jgi:uncharacterized protein (TIGR03067 family)
MVKPTDMKITTHLLGLILITALLGTLGCSTTRQSETAKLQGTWTGTALNESEPGTFIVSGSTFEFRGADPRVWYKGTFSLREDTQPKQFIAHIAETGISQYAGKTAIAIYKIEDKTLTIAADEPGNDGTPTAFDAPGAACFVLKKQ